MAWLLSTEPLTLWDVQENGRKALRDEKAGCTPPTVDGAAGGRGSRPATHAAAARSRRSDGDRRRRRRRSPEHDTEPEELPGFLSRRLI